MKWPDAVPFDPSRGTASSMVSQLLEGPGSASPVLLLAVGTAAQQSGWAARSVIALADALAAHGESVILADLSLDRPELHAVLGCNNDEGLTDVFLFGASLEHTTLVVPGKPFRLIPASAYTPADREVLQHPRWRGVFEEFAQSQDKLLVYLPVDVDGAASLADRVGHTVVLAHASELQHVRAVLASDAAVISVLTAPESHAPAAIPARESAASRSPFSMERDETDFEKIRIPKDGAREALIADLRARQRAALMSPAPDMEPLPHDETAAAPSRATAGAETGAGGEPSAKIFSLRPPPADVQASGARSLWLFLVLLVVLLAAATWYVWQTRGTTGNDQTSPAPGGDTGARTAVSPNALAQARVTAGRALPYSVAIAGYHDLEVALGRVDQLVEQAPQFTYYVGPIDVQGRVFYRIMAGPMPDSASALLLRDTLVVKRIKTISSSWDVLNTPFAFLLGQYDERAEADTQCESAVRKGVPCYVLQNTGAEGEIQYNVYAGAYTGPGDAEFMRPILKSAGLPDNLVERTGSIRS